MGFQIWRLDNVENVLGASRTAIDASEIAIEHRAHSRRCFQGFNRGFDEALSYLATLLSLEPPSRAIWFSDDIRNYIEAARALYLGPGDPNRTDDYDQGYQTAYEAALKCITASFGVKAGSTSPDSVGSIAPLFVRYPNSWLADDVLNILIAIRQLVQTTVTMIARNNGQQLAYFRGFKAALKSVAKVFGVRLLLPTSDISSERNYQSWLSVKDIEYGLRLIGQNVPPAAAETGTDPAAILSHNRGFEAGLQYVATSFGVISALQRGDSAQADLTDRQASRH